MPTLLEKIKASADARLPLPPGRQPSQELARYKAYLKVETHRLKILHRGGGSGGGGRAVCRARATVLDLLLCHILDAVRAAMPSPPDKPPALALVATGGYGRAELNPYSDIDIMFLYGGEQVHGNKAAPYLAALADGLLYTLWDIGLKVGHAVRSVENCVKVANSDMQSKTSLIEARLITGDTTLFDRMQRVVLAKCVADHEDEYIAARLADQAARRAKHGNSATMQEPNIKNGCGGLRDFQNLLWMTHFKHRTRALEELQSRELISPAEARQLDTAYDFLLRSRNELHYHTERGADVLTKSVQPHVAYQLGYTDRSPSRRLERFMRVYYTHARNIDLITRTLEQRLALVTKPSRLSAIAGLIRRRPKEIVLDGFKIVGNEISAASTRVFRDQPRRLMRVFLHVQQRSLKLHPDLAQMIRQQLHLADGELLRDEHVHQTFLELLNQRGNVAPVLRLMHETGFLGKYMPEFGRLTCLVQHEFYHQYTADEHTLICLEKLDSLWNGNPIANGRYQEIFRQIERPFVLYLALLLHDAGKSDAKGAHEKAGAVLARRVARRLRLDENTSHVLQLLVEHHLLMAVVSQRRDLEDPEAIRQFAGTVVTNETLAMLTLHSVADTLGTSDKLWNGFKDTLLSTLYTKTHQLLTGSTDFQHAEEAQREALAAEVSRQIGDAVSEEEQSAHFAGLPARYFQIHSAEEISRDLELVHTFIRQVIAEDRALEPAVAWHNEPDRGYASVTVCTWDRSGLFSRIAGSLTAAGLNILGAQIFTRADWVILDRFLVTDARTGRLPDRAEREKFEAQLGRAFTQETDLAPAVARMSAVSSPYQSLEGERIPTTVIFDNNSSSTATVVDIETEDHVGLLYTISHTMAELGLDIVLAKICTEKGAAIDSFYVTEHGGGKVLDSERQAVIRTVLQLSIQYLEKR